MKILVRVFLLLLLQIFVTNTTKISEILQIRVSFGRSTYEILCTHSTNGPGSVVGIATGYGLDCPGVESR
jgi:hypothetical protein